MKRENLERAKEIVSELKSIEKLIKTAYELCNQGQDTPFIHISIKGGGAEYLSDFDNKCLDDFLKSIMNDYMSRKEKLENELETL